MPAKSKSAGTQVIEKIEKGIFKVEWTGMSDSMLTLDFNPLIKTFNLNKGSILHFQTKPVNLRRWGLYLVDRDLYHSIEWYQASFRGAGGKLLSLDDQPGLTPSSVLAFSNTPLFDPKTETWSI